MADDNQDKKVEETTAPAAEEVKTEAAPEKKEEAPAAEEKKVEAAPEKKEAEEVKAPSVELSGKLGKLATELEGLTVLEMSELASYLEEKFGVSAMPMAMAGGAAAGAADAAPAEEKTSFTVVLTASGDNKLGAIKALREFRQDLGLMDAKKMVESAPQNVLENAKKEDAEAAKAKLEAAGAKVELK